MTRRTRTRRPLTVILAVVLAGGLTVAVAPAAEAAKSDCPSNRLCVWDGASYTGRMQSIGATNSYQAINLSTVRSFYNRRSDRTWLHQDLDGGGYKLCLDPSDANSNVSVTWQRNAEGAYLSTTTYC